MSFWEYEILNGSEVTFWARSSSTRATCLAYSDIWTFRLSCSSRASCSCWWIAWKNKEDGEQLEKYVGQKEVFKSKAFFLRCKIKTNPWLARLRRWVYCKIPYVVWRMWWITFSPTWCSSVMVLRSVWSRLFSFKATSLPLVISANSSSLESNCLLTLLISLSFRPPCSMAWLSRRKTKVFSVLVCY